MRCSDARRALAAWSVRSARQLDDDVALHLDACPGCREAFDAAFAPIPVPPDPIAGRLVVRAPGRPRWPAVAAAAAVVLVALAHEPPTAGAVSVARDLPECSVLDEPPVDATCDV